MPYLNKKTPQLVTATDSPLSDEVNKLLTELAHWKNWRILLGKSKTIKTTSKLFIWDDVAALTEETRYLTAHS